MLILVSIRQVPTQSVARTPDRAPPAHSLDLSDSEAGDQVGNQVVAFSLFYIELCFLLLRK